MKLYPIVSLPKMLQLSSAKRLLVSKNTFFNNLNKAVLTNQGHPARRAEAKEMRKALEQTGVEVFDMTEEPDSHVDGGDVLFTGSEIFIGDSKRSNKAGAEFLRKSFGIPGKAK